MSFVIDFRRAVAPSPQQKQACSQPDPAEQYAFYFFEQDDEQQWRTFWTLQERAAKDAECDYWRHLPQTRWMYTALHEYVRETLKRALFAPTFPITNNPTRFVQVYEAFYLSFYYQWLEVEAPERGQVLQFMRSRIQSESQISEVDWTRVQEILATLPTIRD